MNDLREKLVALEHDRWSRWEKYREKAAIGHHPSGEPNLKRWYRQREMSYEDLTEVEKDSDRAEADKTLAVVAPELDRLWTENEKLRMQLVACSTAALANTANAAQERIDNNSPYYSESYNDVCGAVDREMGFRAENERLKGLLTRPYPIQSGPSVPWWVMTPHEAQSQRNHGQSITRIAERGGFSPAEAWCIVTGQRLREVENNLDRADRLWRAFAARVNDPRETKDVATILGELERADRTCPRCGSLLVDTATPAAQTPTPGRIDRHECSKVGCDFWVAASELDDPLPEDLFVIFDGPPSHESGRFVEVETADGRSVSAGEWRERAAGLWSLGPFRRVPQE